MHQDVLLKAFLIFCAVSPQFQSKNVHRKLPGTVYCTSRLQTFFWLEIGHEVVNDLVIGEIFIFKKIWPKIQIVFLYQFNLV